MIAPVDLRWCKEREHRERIWRRALRRSEQTITEVKVRYPLRNCLACGERHR